MDVQTGRIRDDDANGPTYRVRISDPGEIAAAVPYLLGFQPRESVVLVTLGGASGGRLGLTVRVDLPPPGQEAAAARVLVRGAATARPSGVVALIISDAPDVPVSPLVPGEDGAEVDLPHRGVLHEVVLALAAVDIPVRDALLVRDDRWWSYDCPHPCCVPGAGTAMPLPETTALAAASVATGQVVEVDRGRLTERIAPITGRSADAMAEIAAREGARYARDTCTDEARTSRQSWTTIRRAVDRCRPGAGSAAVRLSSREVARVLWPLTDLRIRDRALGFALGGEAPAAEVLWTECTRRAPAALVAPPATLLAVSAWLRGDGAMANVALERALASDPGYRFATLLAHGLAICLPPEELRATVRATVAEIERSAG